MSISEDKLAFGKGVYGATEALRLINFRRDKATNFRPVSRQTIGRWIRGYDYEVNGETHHSDPLWKSDYLTGDEQDFEVSFRDLIELRFVKTFRDLHLGLQTIRECFSRAVEEVQDPRPFSTQKFRTDGKTIFLEITNGLKDPQLLDLRRRQGVFRSVVEPTLRDLEFDANTLARWYPLGKNRPTIVVDPSFSFGRPIVGKYGVPTQVLAAALRTEGSIEKVARAYEMPAAAVKDALAFEEKLAA
jgi:uncharacterized protein (DUF433 family)